MDSFFTFTWIWKALRGRSITFAALFAFTLTGLSVLSWVRGGLRAIGAPWFALLLIPVVLLAFLARKETQWVPDEQERLKWARGLIFGSMIAALLAALILPEAPRPERDVERVPIRRITGPRGK